MADADSKGGKRLSADREGASRKKVKKEEAEDEPKYNPYLAHMKEDNGADSDGTIDPSSPFAGFKQRATTAKQAEKVEDLDTNAFTGCPHSQKYFQILQTRRDLPVHKQRCAYPLPVVLYG